MPSKTDKQHRAMEAAAHGNSTLGIPAKVGQDFVAADKAKAKGKPAQLAKGGKLFDRGDHFEVHTAGGDKYRIAHKGLHPSTVKHLQKFAEGGTVPHYADGRGPGDEETEADAPSWEQAPGKGVMTDYGRALTKVQKQDETKRELEAREGGERAEGNPAPLTMSAISPNLSIQDQIALGSDVARQQNQSEFGRGSPTKQVATGEVDENGNPVMKEVPNPDYIAPRSEREADAKAKGEAFLKREADLSNQLPQGNQPPVADQPGAAQAALKLEDFKAHHYGQVSPEELKQVAAGNKARTDFSTEQTRISGEQQKVLQQQMDEEKVRQDAYVKSDAEIQGRAQKLREDIANNKIDPDHYWKERGTGGRIMASLGLLLSGVGSGLGGGPNMAMQVIQSNIKRDIDAQEKNLDTQKSLLSDTYRQTGDLRLSRAIAEHSALVIVQAQMNKLAAQSNSADVKMRSEAANAQASLAVAQSQRQINDLNSNAAVDAWNANAQTRNATAMAVAKAKDDAKIPREMQGAKMGNLNAVMKDLDMHLEHLNSAAQGPVWGRIATAFPWGGEDAKANEAAADMLREKLASAIGQGVASDARIKQAMLMVPGPHDTPTQARAKIVRIQELLSTQNQMYAGQQSAVGYKTGPQYEPVTGSKPEGF